jgi:Phage integrase, N-terminal SAM-like domain
MRTILDQTDVIIAGLGPTGATLAGLLGQRGVPGRVLPSSRSSGVITANSGRAGRVDQLARSEMSSTSVVDGEGPGLPAGTCQLKPGPVQQVLSEQTAHKKVDAREDHSGMISPGKTPPARPDRVIEPQADRNYSLRTVRAYGFDLLAFCRWLRDEDVELVKVTAAVLLRLLAACRQAANCRISRDADCYSQHSPLARSSSPGYSVSFASRAEMIRPVSALVRR